MRKYTAIYGMFFAFFLFTPGCQEQFDRKIGETLGLVSAASKAYYGRYGQWPNSAGQLKTFAENELEGFCQIADCNAFNQIDFQLLTNGRLRITFQEKKSDRGKLCTATISQPNSSVWFQKDHDNINVFIKGRHFTTYRFGLELTKPVLYPVKSPSGTVITRGFPLEIIPGESTDHPHHTGVFFAYDKVNDSGFWNNIKSPPQIKHVKVVNAEDGQLSAVSHWVGRTGKVLLEEKRDMRFYTTPDEYAIDFNIMLTAQDEKIVFADTKEGMFAIRLADWLREDGGTGQYLDSLGQKNEPNIWGRRAKWVCIGGRKDSNAIGVAIFNHPDSVNYPAYWMARGYGLFAANPLGQHEFQKATGLKNPQPFNLTLLPGQSAVFKFRLLIYEGQKTPEEIDKEFTTYAR